MSEVKLQVGGRTYTVAVGEGQEDNLRNLAAMVDEKIVGMGKNVSNNEAKNLLFAAILLADDLQEMRKNTAPPSGIAEDADALGDRLERLAGALENVASRLEGGSQAS